MAFACKEEGVRWGGLLWKRVVVCGCSKGHWHTDRTIPGGSKLGVIGLLSFHHY